MKRFYLMIVAMFFLMAPVVNASVSTFDDLTLASESYWNGSDGSGGFTSGDAYFINNYNSTYGSWDGFAYSNTTDATTAGYANQYSAITGGGYNSSNYGVSYMGYSNPPTISFTSAGIVTGMYVTNTTYAYLSMQNGDAFAKKFGGSTGDDADWFMLSVTGIDTAGATTSPIDFPLADFRFADNSLDYIIDEWTWLDLSGFGNDIIGLQFALSSSDVGAWGMNTPAYFALDDVTAVPIPGAVWLLGSGLLGLIGFRKKTSNN